MPRRHIGLFNATSLGVGAIVGGGILALAGIAFAATGPAAILAFALNGGLAFLTAVSFADLARRFPVSGGTYAYARRVMSIEVAFVVGWVVWFASIVAGVLYALGFAAFFAEGLARGAAALGYTNLGIEFGSGAFRVAAAVVSIAGYTALLSWRTAGGGNAATVGKVVVFAIIIVFGLGVWLLGSPIEMLDRLSPFTPSGAIGLLQAMGYTFIALQGFDLIAAVAGEVKEPEKTVPRAMYLSLAIALIVYLPILFVSATVGAPEAGIQVAAQANPDTLVAQSVERFMGTAGYWLVIGAGIMSMLSALHANVFGASRVAFAMAHDRTLPRPLAAITRRFNTPALAVLVTGTFMGVLAVLVGEVSAAAAASSLIFLVSFGTVHWTTILARRRSGETQPPILPLAGVVLCMALAAFQAVAVPEAGAVVAVWLGLGGVLYFALLAPGAKIADASAQATDPDLARLRGRDPLVLVPIANPENAASLVGVAGTARAPGTGRILLLSVIQRETRAVSTGAQAQILYEALKTGAEQSLEPEVLFTTSTDIWEEIARVARNHGCETVVVGLSRLTKPGLESSLNALVEHIGINVVIVRAHHRWNPEDVRRVLVPVRGRRSQSPLRARMLGGLARTSDPEITFLRILEDHEDLQRRERIEQMVREVARDESSRAHEVLFVESHSPIETLAEMAEDVDLVMMGMQRLPSGRSVISPSAMEFARLTDVPLILIGSRRGARPGDVVQAMANLSRLSR